MAATPTVNRIKDRMADSIGAEEATTAFVRERALAMVATNLAPAPFLLLPFALGGLYVGNRLQGRISREQLGRFISVLVLLIGASVILKAVLQG